MRLGLVTGGSTGAAGGVVTTGGVTACWTAGVVVTVALAVFTLAPDTWLAVSVCSTVVSTPRTGAAVTVIVIALEETVCSPSLTFSLAVYLPSFSYVFVGLLLPEVVLS